MREENNYYIWNKGEDYFFPITKNFKTTEFQCQCKHASCKEQRISKTLIEKLVKIRGQILEPMQIHSGFRCHAHQQDLIKQEVNTVVAKKSTHELGDACDVSPIRMKIPTFMTFCAKEFMAIGIAKTFLHLDLRTGYVRRWDY